MTLALSTLYGYLNAALRVPEKAFSLIDGVRSR
jgi:hypothetical protein